MSELSTKDLIQQGLTAARVGDMDDARRLLGEATRQMPDNIEAWLGLAGVVESLGEKRRCFTAVLKLDPDHPEAKAALAIVEKRLAEQERQADKSSAGEAVVAPIPVDGHDHDHHPTELETGIGFCYRHPDVETGLRCNRCNKLICPRCAHRTPVGFRCPDCIREHEDKFYTGGNLDYVIAAVITLPLSFIGAWLFTAIFSRFFIFFLIFIGFFVVAAVAGLIAEIVRRAVGKRRSRYLGHVAAGSLVLGSLPFVLLSLLSGSFFGLLAPGMFLFLGATTIYARLR